MPLEKTTGSYTMVIEVFGNYLQQASYTFSASDFTAIENSLDGDNPYGQSLDICSKLVLNDQLTKIKSFINDNPDLIISTINCTNNFSGQLVTVGDITPEPALVDFVVPNITLNSNSTGSFHIYQGNVDTSEPHDPLNILATSTGVGNNSNTSTGNTFSETMDAIRIDWYNEVISNVELNFLYVNYYLGNTINLNSSAVVYTAVCYYDNVPGALWGASSAIPPTLSPIGPIIPLCIGNTKDYQYCTNGEKIFKYNDGLWDSVLAVLDEAIVAISCSGDGKYITACSGSLVEFGKSPLYVSNDSGKTWIKVIVAKDYTTFIWTYLAMSKTGQFQTALFGSSDPGDQNPEHYGLYYSTDYGKTWEFSPGTLIEAGVALNIIVMNYAGTIQYAIQKYDITIYKSIDYGKTWAPLDSFIPFFVPVVLLSTNGDGSVINAFAETPETFGFGNWYSKDFGQTWTQAQSQVVEQTVSTCMDSSGKNQTVIYYNTGILEARSGSYYSNDYGNTWTESTLFFSKSTTKNSASNVACDASGTYQVALSGNIDEASLTFKIQLYVSDLTV